MSPIQRPETLTEAVVRHIRDAIVRGEYEPGSALPEVRLADELGTSRGTVREALRSLEDQGLVEVVPHRGSFVSRMTKARARDLYGLRAVLEAYAVRLAVESGTLSGPGVAAVEERLVGLERAARTGEPMEMIEAERALHREIWSRCPNQLVLEQLATLQVQTRRLLIYNKAFSSPGSDEIALHRDFVAEIVSGDAERAEVAVRQHIQLSASIVLARMPEDELEHGKVSTFPG